MVEVDPLVVIAAGAAVIGIAAVVLCTSSTSSSNKSEEVEAAVSATKESKPKKKKPKKTDSEQSTKEVTPVPKVKEVAPDVVKEVAPIKGKTPPSKGVKAPKGKSVEAAPVKTVEVVAPVVQETAEVVQESKPVVVEENDEEENIKPEETKSKKKETKEQKEKRLERQKLAKAAKIAEEKSIMAALRDEKPQPREIFETALKQDSSDGWAVVESKQRKNANKKGDAPKGSSSPVPTTAVANEVVSAVANQKDKEPPVTSAPAPAPVPVSSPTPAPVPVPESSVVQVKVDSKKVGLIIGPKGATKIAIQEQAGQGVDIQFPKDKESSGPTIVTVSGPPSGVAKAVKAINELCSRGWTSLLSGDDFREGTVGVTTGSIPLVIGPNGSHLKAMQEALSVKITVPDNISSDKESVKVILAGNKENVQQAKALIKELIKFYHTPITHPGLTHVVLEDVSPDSYRKIIGTKGSEIKHINGNFGVTVHVPREKSEIQHVIVVGKEENVRKAQAYIEKITDPDYIAPSRQKRLDANREDEDVDDEDAVDVETEQYIDPKQRRSDLTFSAGEEKSSPMIDTNGPTPAQAAASGATAAWGPTGPIKF